MSNSLPDVKFELKGRIGKANLGGYLIMSWKTLFRKTYLIGHFVLLIKSQNNAYGVVWSWICVTTNQFVNKVYNGVFTICKHNWEHFDSSFCFI